MEPSWVMSERERKEYNKQLDEKRKMKQVESQKDGEFMVNFFKGCHPIGMDRKFICIASHISTYK